MRLYTTTAQGHGLSLLSSVTTETGRCRNEPRIPRAWWGGVGRGWEKEGVWGGGGGGGKQFTTRQLCPKGLRALDILAIPYRDDDFWLALRLPM